MINFVERFTPVAVVSRIGAISYSKGWKLGRKHEMAALQFYFVYFFVTDIVIKEKLSLTLRDDVHLMLSAPLKFVFFCQSWPIIETRIIRVKFNVGIVQNI